MGLNFGGYILEIDLSNLLREKVSGILLKITLD